MSDNEYPTSGDFCVACHDNFSVICESCYKDLVAKLVDARAEVERLTRERDGARDRILEYTDALVERDAKIVHLTNERDEARAERDQALSRQEDLEADVRYYEDRWEHIVCGAYQRGAEAMREACIGTACAQDLDPDAQDRMEEQLRALQIPEEP